MKSRVIAFGGGSALILTGVSVSGSLALLGALPGYTIGFFLTGWLHRDTLLSSEMDAITAMKRMRRGFFARLGTITLAVAATARFQPGWLPGLAAGIAAGVLISMSASIISKIREGKEG